MEPPLVNLASQDNIIFGYKVVCVYLSRDVFRIDAVWFYNNLVLLKFKDEKIDFIHVYFKVTGRGWC